MGSGRVSPLQPFDVIATRNIVGEGILWNPHRGELWWTDIESGRLHCYDWSRRALEVFAAPERIGSFGLVAGSRQLITAFASGVALYDVHAGKVDWMVRPPEVVPGIRFNDGRVDRQGRFWCGTMSETAQRPADGCLYSMGRNARWQRHVEGVRISNGLCMSADGTRLYFTDSPTQVIQEYELLEPEGRLGKRRDFARTAANASPDGAAIDAEGCLWSAQWGSGCVVRYTPDGKIERTLAVPTRQPTCVCFAGPDLDVLCVTTAKENLDAATLRAEPDAGAVFLYRTGVRGLPESEYRR